MTICRCTKQHDVQEVECPPGHHHPPKPQVVKDVICPRCEEQFVSRDGLVCAWCADQLSGALLTVDPERLSAGRGTP